MPFAPIPRIYLAGPDVFRPDSAQVLARLKASCAQLGLEGLAPADDGPSDSDPRAGDALAQRIYDGNIARIQAADGVLANLQCFRGTEPDAGTVFEVGYAVALGKPVVAYGVPPGSYAERIQQGTPCEPDAAGVLRELACGTMVEGLGQRLNLMLARSTEIEATAEAALQRLAVLLGVRTDGSLQSRAVNLPHPAPPAPTDTAPATADTSAAAAPHQAPPDVAHPRAIRTFVKRAGRTTTGQAKATAELGPRFVLPYVAEPLDLTAAFGRAAPTVLEIGFGMGDATAHIAQVLPDINFLCCEVHEPGVGALLKHMGERDLQNIRILAHDAVEVLDHMLPPWDAEQQPQGLAGIHIFFPDPWHKSRHHKRRLIQPPFVARLVQRLAPGGYLHLATDWEPYAHQMLEVLGAEPLLANTATDFAPRPHYRPDTKFERRGLKLGHGVWDLVFRRK